LKLVGEIYTRDHVVVLLAFYSFIECNRFKYFSWKW